jgi:hypothetical protein
MRWILLLPCLLLAGCGGVPQTEALVASASVASIVMFQRSGFDALYSVITGKDCSIVRLSRDESYCRPVEPEPTPPQYCTRSLGSVDCWKSAQNLGTPPPRGVADGPDRLNALQEQNRTRRWPDF